MSYLQKTLHHNSNAKVTEIVKGDFTKYRQAGLNAAMKPDSTLVLEELLPEIKIRKIRSKIL